jgi:GH24 family phage-related lysozyme (muramidase)
MAERHKHADVIIAWANGAKIQFRRIADGDEKQGSWTDAQRNLGWYPNYEYRVKPEPKPDVVVYSNIYKTGPGAGHPSIATATAKANDWKDEVLGMLKLTYDGETGKPKSVEIIE